MPDKQDKNIVEDKKPQALIKFRYYANGRVDSKFFFSESIETARVEALEFCVSRQYPYRFVEVEDVLIPMQNTLKVLRVNEGLRKKANTELDTVIHEEPGIPAASA